MDPVKVRRARLDGFEIAKAPVAFDVPMSRERTSNVVEKLTITLSYAPEKPKNITMKVAWGNLALRAPIEVSVAP